MAGLRSRVALGLWKFVAYRPLLQNATRHPSSSPLISAIGASFVLSEAMGLRDKPFKVVGADDDLADYVGNVPVRPLAARSTINTVRLFYIFDYTRVERRPHRLGSAIVMMVVLDQFVAEIPCSAVVSAPSRRTPRPPPLMGVNSRPGDPS
jgi:branched-chain amino acid transport system permease protein